MVKHLTLFYFVAITGTAFTADAEVLRDPTTPPMQLEQAGANNKPLGGPVLQSVMLSMHQKAAIINGQYVKLGKKYEQSVLVRVTESEAILQAADGSKQVLKMEYPLQKKPIITPLASAHQRLRAKSALQDASDANNKREAL